MNEFRSVGRVRTRRYAVNSDREPFSVILLPEIGEAGFLYFLRKL